MTETKILPEEVLEPIQTFFYYNQPFLFTAKIEGQVRLLLVVSDSRNHTSWRVATPDNQTILDMDEDRLAVREAFTHGPFFRIDWERGGDLTVLPIDVIEPNYLPRKGVFLHLDTEEERS